MRRAIILTTLAALALPTAASAKAVSALTVCGTSPSEAGPKNADAAPKIAAVIKNSGSVMLCVKSIAAVNA